MNKRNVIALAAVVSVATMSLGSTDSHDAPAHGTASHDASAQATPAAAPAANPAHASETKSAGPTADEAIAMLVEGNDRFVSSQSGHGNAGQARRCDTFTNGQHPFAVVLSCADSRVPPEILFDQGIGDLFVIRVAGNVADTDEIGTIEYGIGHLNSPLVVVMGHSKCGAVTAVVQGAKVGENIAKLVDNIVPATESVKKAMPGLKVEALVSASIDANVMQGISDLLTHSEETRHLVSSGKVKVVGAVYDLHNGTIRWLGEHPQQSALLGGGHGAPAHAEQNATSTAGHSPVEAHDNHAKPTAKAASHGESHADIHQDPQSKADEGATLPHHSGTMKSMLLPATFLGGAGLMSGTIFYVMKNRGGTTEQPAVPTPQPRSEPAEA